MTAYPSENDLIRMSRAPRVTLEAVEANILAEHYFTGYEGRMGSVVDGTYSMVGPGAGTLEDLESLKLLTFCVLVLKNGYTVHGISACASKANFNREIGRAIARKNAIDQVWGLMGYELKTKLHHEEMISNGDPLGEALTRLLALSFGNAEAMSADHARIILNELIPSNIESNEDIAKIAYEAVRSWDDLNGSAYSPPWAETAEMVREDAIDRVAHYRANRDLDLTAEPFKNKLFAAVVWASLKPPIAPSKGNHLRAV